MIYSIDDKHPMRHVVRGEVHDYKVVESEHFEGSVDLRAEGRLPIQGVKDAYFLGWGILTTGDQNYGMSMHEYDADLLLTKAHEAVRFEEKGLKGLRDRDGALVVPAIFGQIEVGKDWIYLRWDDDICCLVRRLGGYTQWSERYETPVREGFFVKDGKMGWMKQGKVVLPAAYDNVSCLSGYDVYPVEKDGRCFYVDGSGTEVLSHLGGGLNTCSNGPSSMMLQEIAPDGMEGAVRRYNGESVCINRFTVDGFSSMMRDASVVSLDDSSMELLHDECSYLFSAYRASVRGPGRMSSCIDILFHALGAGRNTWHYLVHISAGKDNPVTAGELRELRRHFQDWTHEPPLSVRVAVDCDEDVTDDTMTVTMVTHFHEVGPGFLDRKELLDFMTAGDSESFFRRVRHLSRWSPGKDTSGKDTLGNYTSCKDAPGEVKRLLWNIYYGKDCDWRKTRAMLDCLAEHFNIGCCGFDSFAYIMDGASSLVFHTVSDARFAARFVEWALDHGFDPNTVESGRTLLDCLEGTTRGVSCLSASDMRKVGKTKLELLRRTRMLVILHGGKTMAQLRAEEPEEADFSEELRLLSQI